jgi:predicted AlkP superfamily pyrophosphatase or phosphodiesterase
MLAFYGRLLRCFRRGLFAIGVLAGTVPLVYMVLFPPPCLICVVRPEDRPRVLIIGIDGLTVRALGTGNTPVLDRLIKTSAFSLSAQANLPTMSSPNWASHLLGASPREHKIETNDWRPEDHAGQSYCGRAKGEGWPTIFHLMEDQIRGAHTVIVHDWVGILRFVPRSHVDTRRFTLTPWYTQYIAHRQLAKEPDLMFVHFDQADGAGHSFGYDSWQYLRAVAQADGYVGELLADLEARGLRDKTLVMVVSDHGATQRGHGGASPDERTVPWILSGLGVKPGQIEGSVRVHDTAATAAMVLGLTVPDCWTGRAVQEAFVPETRR